MKFADRVKGMKASEIRKLLKFCMKPEVISLAGGLPSPDSFPIKELQKITLGVLEKNGKNALQYGETEGVDFFRESLAKRSKRFGIKCDKDDIIVTPGSQMALDLIAKVFINPGDFVAVEVPTYLGAICAFRNFQTRFLPIKMDEEGMLVDELEKKLAECKRKKKPVKFIYVVPTFQNPSGITMSLERRKHLLEIAGKYNLPIVEDDPYSELRYSGKCIPSIKSLDKNESVIYMSTFSKILSPGFRLGWVVDSKKMMRKIAIAKQGTDLCTNVFVQYIANEYLKKSMDKQIPKIVKMYKRKRDVMLKALDKYFPEKCSWSKPDGGLFLWVNLPKKINTKKMFKEAVKNKVAYVHGAAFCVDGSGYNSMRLNFSHEKEKDIEEGIKRLAKLIKKKL